MADSLDIAQVARLTGVTSRALRFYEARGLIAPMRTGSGRRHYGPAELERLHQILALKRAGLSLAQIQRLTSNRQLDLRELVSAQIAALEAQEREIAKARALLKSILSCIDRSEPIDVATFCSLIQQGDITMATEQWNKVASRYVTEAQMAEISAHREKLGETFDLADYSARWKALVGRIKGALPLDPASEQAQALLAETRALLAPLTASVPQAMKEGSRKMSAHFDEWEGDVGPALDTEVFRFIQAAGKAAAGDRGSR